MTTSLAPLFRAALYARVFSDRQAKAGSINSQIDPLRQAIAADGATLLPEDCYIDDGYSGDTLLRPDLERLRDRVAAGMLDRLYIFCPDRLTRSYGHLILLNEEFTRHCVELKFLNRPLDGSPEDTLLGQIQVAVAEYERTKILERNRRGRLHAAKRGSVSVLSAAPYGYRYVTRQQGEGQARYHVLEQQAQVVRLIFSLVGEQRWTLRRVCKHLHDKDIASPGGKEWWPPNAIGRLLSNPAYKGQAAYGRTQGCPKRPVLRPARGHPEVSRRQRSSIKTPEQAISIAVPALVSEDLFNQVAEQLKENRQRQRERHEAGQNRYLLSGLVVCKKCGYSLYGKESGKKGYCYYRCRGSDASRLSGTRICQGRGLRCAELDEGVWQDVRELLADPDMLEREYKRREEQMKAEGSKGKKNSEAQIEATKRKLERLIDAYTEGLLNKEEFESRSKTLREQIRQLQEQDKKQQQQRQKEADLRVVLESWKDLAKHAQEGLENADDLLKREIIRTLVKRVEIDTDDITVVYRVVLPPFEPGPSGGFLQHCHGRFRARFLHESLTPSPLPDSRTRLDDSCAKGRGTLETSRFLVVPRPFAQACGDCPVSL